jgi:hypothetical protein
VLAVRYAPQRIRGLRAGRVLLNGYNASVSAIDCVLYGYEASVQATDYSIAHGYKASVSAKDCLISTDTRPPCRRDVLDGYDASVPA